MSVIVIPMLYRLLALFMLASVFAMPIGADARSAHRQYTASESQDINSHAPALYTSEAAAQRACPSDQVVWLNLNSGIYHEKGMRWYGNTRVGAYVCRKDADKTGNRDTRNGQ